MARSALDAARAAAHGRRVSRSGADRADRRRGLTGPGPDAGDPQPFGALIDRLVRDRGWQRTAAEAAVMGRWESLVGDDVAAHCRPESLRDGELVLVAESTAWATQLRALAAGMLATLARELGAGVVTRIRVRGPTAPNWHRGPRHIPGRGPRDTYG
ncbi:MAG: DciA family protein [Actinomycetota bacterium]|nr:DciA family protein [Actinomycetota bacterium]